MSTDEIKSSDLPDESKKQLLKEISMGIKMRFKLPNHIPENLWNELSTKYKPTVRLFYSREEDKIQNIPIYLNGQLL